jgi:hypothetical protein
MVRILFASFRKPSADTEKVKCDSPVRVPNGREDALHRHRPAYLAGIGSVAREKGEEVKNRTRINDRVAANEHW